VARRGDHYQGVVHEVLPDEILVPRRLPGDRHVCTVVGQRGQHERTIADLQAHLQRGVKFVEPCNVGRQEVAGRRDHGEPQHTHRVMGRVRVQAYLRTIAEFGRKMEPGSRLCYRFSV